MHGSIQGSDSIDLLSVKFGEFHQPSSAFSIGRSLGYSPRLCGPSRWLLTDEKSRCSRYRNVDSIFATGTCSDGHDKFKCSLFQVVGLSSPIASHAMFDWTTTGALAIGSVVFLYIGRRALKNRSSYPLPPGPPGLPWVGNIIGVNTSPPWVTYTEWGRTYGRLQLEHVQVYVLYSLRYPSRRLGFLSAVGTGYHYPQFGKGCKGIAREPVQELFGSSKFHHQRNVGSSFLIRAVNLIPLLQVWTGLQFCDFAIRGPMATAQALFPPDVSARIGAQISALSAPQGMSSPPAVVRCARTTR